LAGGLTLLCAAADAALLWLCVALPRTPRAREDSITGFIISVAGLGAVLSLARVLWQGLPVLIRHYGGAAAWPAGRFTEIAGAGGADRARRGSARRTRVRPPLVRRARAELREGEAAATGRRTPAPPA